MTEPSDVDGTERGARAGGAAPSRLRSKLPWFGLAAATLVLDLWTKHIVFTASVEPGTVLVTQLFDGFRIIQVYNPGITFGMLEGSAPWILGLLTGAVIVALCWKLWHLRTTERLQSFALAIVVGGAIGNLYDRVLRTPPSPAESGVRDFLDWYVPEQLALGQWLKSWCGTNHWYTSNVADVFIVCGVILLAWCILTERDPAAAADACEAAGESAMSDGSSPATVRDEGALPS